MITNLPSVLREYAKQNAHPPIDFSKDEVVCVSIKGVVSIEEWNLPWPQPTMAELENYASAAEVSDETDGLLAHVEHVSAEKQLALGDPIR